MAMGLSCLITMWGEPPGINILFTLLFIYLGVKWGYSIAAS